MRDSEIAGPYLTFPDVDLLDKKTRDKAVKALGRWISSKKDFSHLELMKLWKGLFYCKGSRIDLHVDLKGVRGKGTIGSTRF